MKQAFNKARLMTILLAGGLTACNPKSYPLQGQSSPSMAASVPADAAQFDNSIVAGAAKERLMEDQAWLSEVTQNFTPYKFSQEKSIWSDSEGPAIAIGYTDIGDGKRRIFEVIVMGIESDTMHIEYSYYPYDGHARSSYLREIEVSRNGRPKEKTVFDDEHGRIIEQTDYLKKIKYECAYHKEGRTETYTDKRSVEVLKFDEAGVPISREYSKAGKDAFLLSEREIIRSP